MTLSDKDTNESKGLMDEAVSATLLPEGYKPSADEEFMNPLQLEYFRQKQTKHCKISLANHYISQIRWTERKLKALPRLIYAQEIANANSFKKLSQPFAVSKMAAMAIVKIQMSPLALNVLKRVLSPQ